MKAKKLIAHSAIAYLAIELAEELLEELIALGISSFFVKISSAFIIVGLTQGVKLAIKKIVKMITYKEGNDKVEKLKTIGKWLWANKKTLGGTLSVALIGASGAGLIDVSGLPELLIAGFNITPILYYVFLGVFALIGVYGKGLEKIADFFARVGLIKAKKAQDKLRQEALNEIKADEKLANQTQAEQEKAEAKAKHEEEMKAQKEKAEAEHKAKVAELKAQILAERKAKEEQEPVEVQ